MDSNAAAVSFYINAISIRRSRKLHVNISIDINITLSYFHTGTFFEVIRTVLDYQLVSLDGGCAFNCLLEQRHSTNIVTLFSHQYQLVVACINGQRCFYLYSIFSCSVNRSVSTEYILAVLNVAYIFGISCSVTGQSSSKLCLRRNNRSFGRIAAFAVLFAEGNVTGLQCCRGSSQAVGNLHITGQVAFAVYVVAVGQLACQCVKYVGYAVLVIHCNTSVIGNQGNNGILLCMLDNGVACCIIACCFTIASMCVEDVGVTAVVINSQVIAVLLEDVACFCFALTANQFCYMAACPFFADLRILNNLVNNLVIPGCAVLQPQVCRTGKG